jgi:phytoene dehydrogenase-like protein
MTLASGVREQKRSWDVVVAGGGHNGLVAAAYLGRAGLSVLLLEKLPRLGGATSSQEVFRGVSARLSRYSYLISLLPPKVINDLGLHLDLRRRRIAACAPYDRDGKHRALLLSNDHPELGRESLVELGGEITARQLEHFEQLQGEYARLVHPTLIEPLRSRSDWKASLKTADEHELWDNFVEHPLGEGLERLIEDDLIRGLILTDAKTGMFTDAHDPRLTQNRIFTYHGTGTWSVPVGGMGSLVSELTRVASEAGVVALTDATVERIHPGNDRHTVEVSLGGHPMEIDAKWVLVNSGPQTLAAMLDRPHHPSAEDEGAVVKANMLLRRLPRLRSGVSSEDAFAGTFRINERYSEMESAHRELAAGEIPAKPPAEVYCHTLTDPSILSPGLRAAGCHTLTLFGYDIPYSMARDFGPGFADEIWKRYLAGLDAMLDEPFEECLAYDIEGKPCLEVKTAVDLEADLGLDRGNIFHNAISWFFTDEHDEVGSWGVETDVPRVYRAGASAARGGAVSGIPGHNAAQRVLADRA